MDAVGGAICPYCKQTFNLPIRISIENLKTLSMILWTHENEIVCPNCSKKSLPYISAFEHKSLRWGMRPVDGKPVIERPGVMDVSRILKQ